jgi:hypothetical protein
MACLLGEWEGENKKEKRGEEREKGGKSSFPSFFLPSPQSA